MVLRTAILVLALAGASWAQDDARARDLLMAAGRKLRGLKTFKASLEFRTETSTEPTPITLVFKRPMLWRFERSVPGRVPSISLNDGNAIWSIMPDHRSFVRNMDQNNSLDHYGGALAVLFVYPDGAPILEGAVRVQVKKDKIGKDECDVVLVERKVAQTRVEVWIDQDKKVRRQVFRQHIKTDKEEIDTERTHEYGEQVASPEVDDAIFSFEPPADFKETFPRPQDPSLLAANGPCPDFELTDLAGKKFKLSDYKKKPLVLVFWSEKAPDLGETLEAIDRLAASNPDAAFVAVNQGTPPKGIKDLLGKTKPAARIALQKTDEASKAFGVLRYPTTYVIGPDRMIAARNGGFSEGQIRAALKALADKK